MSKRKKIKNKKANSSNETVPKKETVKSKATRNWPDLSSYKIPMIASISAILVALALSFIQYSQSIPYEFVLDDKIVISENNFVKKGIGGMGDILMTEGFVGYFGEQKDLIPGARYRPLSLITFALEYEIFGGLNSKASHFINILLYALCGWLVFLMLGRIYPIEKKWWFSLPFLVLIIWMSHAVHTEVVANIKSRDEIMSLIFSCLTLILSFNFYRKSNYLHLIGAAVAFFLGLMSKETTLTFLAIIPAALYFFRKPDTKKMLLVFAALIVPLVIYLILRITAIGYLLSSEESTDIMNNPFYNLSFAETSGTILYTLLKYLGLSYIPYPLTHDYYPFQIPKVGFTNPVVITSILIHLAVGFYIIKNFFSRNQWVFPMFWYVASLSIASNIVINVGTTMNERFIFTPTVGTCILIVLALQWLTKKYDLNKLIPPIAIGAISIVYLLISLNRTQVWQNSLTLNQAAVKVSTNSARANSFMATALFNEATKRTSDRAKKLELFDEAEIYAKKAIDLFPSYQNANLMLAGIAGERHKQGGSLDDLLRDFTIAASNNPKISFIHEYIDYISGRNLDQDKMINFFYNVGHNVLVEQKGIYDWGIKFLDYGYKMQPNNPAITFAISKAYRKLGNPGQADLYLSKTLQIDPSYQNK